MGAAHYPTASGKHTVYCRLGSVTGIGCGALCHAATSINTHHQLGGSTSGIKYNVINDQSTYAANTSRKQAVTWQSTLPILKAIKLQPSYIATPASRNGHVCEMFFKPAVLCDASGGRQQQDPVNHKASNCANSPKETPEL